MKLCNTKKLVHIIWNNLKFKIKNWRCWHQYSLANLKETTEDERCGSKLMTTCSFSLNWSKWLFYLIHIGWFPCMFQTILKRQVQNSVFLLFNISFWTDLILNLNDSDIVLTLTLMDVAKLNYMIDNGCFMTGVVFRSI